jgi:multisubunit Na+/H+ antiporter MnhE subunit
MAQDAGPRAGSGQPVRQREEVALSRRVGSWVIWWVLLMAFWVWVDDSLGLAELLAGAGAAALGAFAAELVQYQAATRFRARIEWVAPALRLPARLARDLYVVLGALWKRIVHGEDPDSGFRVFPLRYGDESPEGVTRRVLIVAGTSFTPNTFVLGVDRDRNVVVVHDLVPLSGPARR